MEDKIDEIANPSREMRQRRGCIAVIIVKFDIFTIRPQEANNFDGIVSPVFGDLMFWERYKSLKHFKKDDNIREGCCSLSFVGERPLLLLHLPCHISRDLRENAIEELIQGEHYWNVFNLDGCDKYEGESERERDAIRRGEKQVPNKNLLFSSCIWQWKMCTVVFHWHSNMRCVSLPPSQRPIWLCLESSYILLLNDV